MEGTAYSQRRLAAIMFADICEYSRMMNANEERTLEVVKRFDQLISASVMEFDGNVIKRMGDGIMAEFHSAVGAVECALTIQRRVMARNVRVEEGDQFQLRIGVHLGDVVVAGNDLLGDGVNVASRIEPLAPPGGICISQDIYSQVHNKIEMVAVPLGPHQLKNIEGQIEIYRVLADAAGSIPVSDPHRRSTGKLRGWKLAGLVVSVLFLVLFGQAVKRNQRRLRRQKTIEKTIATAHDHVAADEPAEARKLLESLLPGLREGPDLVRVREALAVIEEKESAQRIRTRARDLFASVKAENWDACVEFAHPDSKMQHGVKGVRGRMMLLGVMRGLLRLDRDDLRLESVELSEDRQSATVAMELKLGQQWQRQKPQTWKRHEDEWHLIVE